MGNKPCTVGIRTDQETYDAGSIVTGTIYVSITTSKPVQVTSLNLSFVGEERVVIHHTTSESHTDYEGRTRNRHRDHYERANCIFYKFDYPIAQFQGKEGGMIAPGQYEYPFQVNLPKDLPGCMSCVQGESRCDIVYQMTAHFVQPNAGFFSKPPHFTKPFGVLAHTDSQHNDVAGIVLPPEVTPIKTCCFGKGTMTLQCQIDKSILSPHENLEIQFTGRNQSTAKVLNVKVEIDEIVEWRAHGHSEKFTRAASERLLAGGHEMPEFQELERVPRRHHYFGTPDSSDATTSLTNNNSPCRKTFLVVPGDIRDTYHGNLMEVRHIVTIRLVTSGKCCTTSPESCVALQVRRRPTGEESAAETSATGPVYNDSTTMMTPTAPTEDTEPWSSSSSAPVETPPAYAPATATTTAASNSNNNNNNEYPSHTAPPQQYGDYDDVAGNDFVMAQAEPVLPVDWSAQTANVVEIPMAQAMLLDFDHPSPSAPLPPSGTYT